MRWFRDVQAVLTSVCGVFLVLTFFLPYDALAYISVAAGSYFALKSGYESLRERTLDVNFLMIFAAIGAVVVGRPTDAAALLFLFSLSSTLESYAMSRTRSAIEGLIKLRPDTALRVTDSGDETVATSTLVQGDRVRVAAFASIPADGRVLQGETSVDQSAMTGESIPVSKGVNDLVLAGTQNMDGMFIMEVSAPVGSSTLDKVVDLVRDAQENKASGERISTWFGQRYTIFVLVVFIIAFSVRLAIKEPLPVALYGALVLLVALSPCALVISSPASTLSALAWAGKRGILIRGGEFLERLGKVDTLAIDKTGTLTAGKPVLIEICVCAPVGVGTSMSREEDSCWHGTGLLSKEASRMLRAAAAAEQYSSHPIAEAIVLAARNAGISVPEAVDQRDHAGLGVTARIDDGEVKVGQRRFFEELPSDFADHLEELQGRGMTVAVLEFDGRLAALGLRDEPRPEAASVLNELGGLGIAHIMMMTGDTIQTAKAVAAELKITDIQAGLMPQDKTELIDRMSREGHEVLMVGDGINDAPSLARASVGVAMGGLGSDVTLNAADIVLMQDRLDRLPEIIRLGRRTSSIIRANLIFAATVIICLTVSSLFFTLPLPIAVIGHEGSTVLVILNGLRLLGGTGVK